MQRWNEALNRYLKTPKAQEHFRRNQMTIVGGSSSSLAEYYKSETARWGGVIRAAGIKPQ